MPTKADFQASISPENKELIRAMVRYLISQGDTPAPQQLQTLMMGYAGDVISRLFDDLTDEQAMFASFSLGVAAQNAAPEQVVKLFGMLDGSFVHSDYALKDTATMLVESITGLFEFVQEVIEEEDESSQQDGEAPAS